MCEWVCVCVRSCFFSAICVHESLCVWMNWCPCMRARVCACMFLVYIIWFQHETHYYMHVDMRSAPNQIIYTPILLIEKKTVGCKIGLSFYCGKNACQCEYPFVVQKLLHDTFHISIFSSFFYLIRSLRIRFICSVFVVFVLFTTIIIITTTVTITITITEIIEIMSWWIAWCMWGTCWRWRRRRRQHTSSYSQVNDLCANFRIIIQQWQWQWQQQYNEWTDAGRREVTSNAKRNQDEVHSHAICDKYLVSV